MSRTEYQNTEKAEGLCHESLSLRSNASALPQDLSILPSLEKSAISLFAAIDCSECNSWTCLPADNSVGGEIDGGLCDLWSEYKLGTM